MSFASIDRVNGKPVRHTLKTTSKKEARRKALVLERDLANGELTRSPRAPHITETIEQYIAHLRAQRRCTRTIGKSQFAFKLLLELALIRGVTRIDQIDLAFVDAFKLARNTRRVTLMKKADHAESQTENNS